MRRTLVAGVVAAALASAAGCGADEPRPRIAEPTATATASKSSSASPSTGPSPAPTQAPDLPPAAAQATKEGAIAFTKYFWALTTYAQKTGDVAELRDLVADSCDTCLGAINAIQMSTRGRREVTGGDITVSTAKAQTFSPSSGQTGAAVRFTTRNEAQVVRLDGRVVDRFSAATLRSRFLLLHTPSSWRVDIWRIEEP